ncbi:MAG TPA: metal-dependent hydrolase [Bryobacteraceae bacterium]|nr:metal-dependent hydrolase [Bryobacteraceae bacterium]
MDPLTHAATGLFLSRAGLKRFTPQATAILVLAAMAPDIDIVTAAGGSLNYLHYHRHLTHSLLAMPVMAILPVAVVRLAGRKAVNWRGAFLIALAAVATHLLLDLTNVYGIRLLLPFSAKWLQLGWTSVVDLWIWGALFLGIAAPFLARLVGSEISSGARKERHHGRGFAIFALLFLLLYNCGRGVLHARAAAMLDSRVYRQAAPLRVVAAPDPVDPLRWRGVVETRDFYADAAIDLTQDFDPAQAVIFHKPEADPALDAARRTPVFQTFLQFSQYPLWQISPVAEPEGGKLVEVVDMRFGTPLQPSFMASAIVDARNQVVNASFQFGRLHPR